jgi:hypothetical protein
VVLGDAVLAAACAADEKAERVSGDELRALRKSLHGHLFFCGRRSTVRFDAAMD